MRISAISRPTPRNSGRAAQAAFTLLEILVVLAIVALLASIALPRLERLAAGVERDNQLTDVKLAIEGLGYEAYRTGKPIVLADAPTGRDSSDAKATSPITLPPGWRVQTPAPIRYSANGVCAGGKLVLVAPDATREAFVLKPPKCHLEPGELPQ